jgi:molecular chaperone IbpA
MPMVGFVTVKCSLNFKETIMNKLTTLDLSPFYRNSVGLDRLFDTMLNRGDNNVNAGYPPYNLIKNDDDHYEVQLALAGFKSTEIDVSVKDGQLIVKADRAETEESGEYIHRGIGVRSFIRTFQLGDYVEVVTAQLVDGILSIKLERLVPEGLKPRKITIETK